MGTCSSQRTGSSYLGSRVTSIFSLDEVVNTQIGKAARTFWQLKKRAWNKRRLKVLIYHRVLSTLFHGSCMDLKHVHHVQGKRKKHKPNNFHLCSFHRILNIKWQVRVTNPELLSHDKLPSMMTTISSRWLTLRRHGTTMDGRGIPSRFCMALKNWRREGGHIIHLNWNIKICANHQRETFLSATGLENLWKIKSHGGEQLCARV